jgi:hypothetical protein
MEFAGEDGLVLPPAGDLPLQVLARALVVAEESDAFAFAAKPLGLSRASQVLPLPAPPVNLTRLSDLVACRSTACRSVRWSCASSASCGSNEPESVIRSPLRCDRMRSRNAGARWVAPLPSFSMACRTRSAGDFMSVWSRISERGHPAIVQSLGTSVYGRLTRYAKRLLSFDPMRLSSQFRKAWREP